MKASRSRICITSVTLVLLALVCAPLSVIPAHGTEYYEYSKAVLVSPLYRYVGPSTSNATMNGQGGMNALCKAKYGPAARMCTSDEVYASAQQPSTAQWFNLSMVNCVYNSAAPGVFCFVLGWPAGLLELNTSVTSCSAWTSTSNSETGYMAVGVGFGIGASGIGFGTCTQSSPVACCEP
jgi:hypothetical protein